MNQPISVRFNEKELQELQDLKDFFNLNGVHGEDSQTIKTAVRVARNVLHNIFGPELATIFKRELILSGSRNVKQFRQKQAKK